MVVQTNILSEGGDGKIPQSHISGSSMEVCMGFHLRYIYIGVKHDYLCINIWWAQQIYHLIFSAGNDVKKGVTIHPMWWQLNCHC